MADELKPVGIKLTAEGRDEFIGAVGDAIDAEEEFVASSKKTADFLTSEWRRAFQSFQQVGETTQTALDAVFQAMEEGVKPTTVIKQNLDLLFEAEQRIVASGGDWVELEKQRAEWSGKRAEALRKEQESLREAALAEEGFASRVMVVLQIGQQFGATSNEIKESLMGIGFWGTCYVSTV